MKIMTQKALLSFYIFVGLSSFSIIPTYCSFDKTVCRGSNKAAICNWRNKTGAKENSPPATKAKWSRQPNVLLIGIETLRADHVSCLGYSRHTTPTLDNLAKEGVAFSRAIATSSWTIPTVMSVLTSLYPGVHKTTHTQRVLPKGITTLAEILKENGYKTVAFISNPTLDRRCGFSKGFDLYDDFTVQFDLGLDLFDNSDKGNQNIHTTMTSEAVNRAAIGWLQKNHRKPFFMFVFYFDPHYDYVPPPPFDTAFDPNYEGSVDGRGINSELRKSTRPRQRDLDHIIALYDGEVLYTDGYVSKLLEKFTEYGILDETLISVFGDHGDEFYEHGSTTHTHTLYNELIHVPLILRWPPEIPKNRRVDVMVSQVDIMPTVLDYLDIKYDGFMQGSSLRTLIERQDEKLHDVLYAEVSAEGNLVFAAAISRYKKLILHLNSGKKQLFDLINDPGEQIDIYKAQSSNEPIALESHLNLWLSNNNKLAKQLSGIEGFHKADLDEDRLRQLKALGYIQ